jgi:hypothetical protein
MKMPLCISMTVTSPLFSIGTTAELHRYLGVHFVVHISFIDSNRDLPKGLSGAYIASFKVSAVMPSTLKLCYNLIF